MARYFLFPFRGAALVLVISFTFGMLLAFRAGLFGLPLALILVSWFLKYCFVLLDAVLAGAEEPPVLSAEMVNPVSEQRPVAQGALIVLGVLLVGFLGKTLGQAAAVLGGTVLVIALPASIAVLGLTSNPFKAAFPPLLLDIIRGVGRDYAIPLVATLGSAGLIVWLARSGVPSWVGLGALQLLFLLIFSLVGGVVFEHRHELGLDSRTERERLQERDQRERVTERNRMIDRAYEQFRVSKPLEGWKVIQDWLALHGQRTDPDELLNEQRAILDAASGWDDVRPADRLANDVIATLLTRRQAGQALELLERRLASNPKFQPAQAVRLAELAAAAGKPALRRRLEAGAA